MSKEKHIISKEKHNLVNSGNIINKKNGILILRKSGKLDENSKKPSL